MSENSQSIFDKAKEKFSDVVHSAEKALITIQECGPFGHNEDTNSDKVDFSNRLFDSRENISDVLKIDGIELPKEGERLDLEKDKELYMKYRNEDPLAPLD